jgi:transcriptional regulator NrdR family protein
MKMDDVMVLKRGGGEEEWSFDKLLASISKTGAELSVAEKVAKSVEGWVMEQQSPVKSDAIRDKVIEFLGKEDPAALDSYQAYKKEG